MNFAITWALKTVVGRWVTGILVTMILGGAVAMWQSYKSGLVSKGQAACVQEINEQTVLDLELALATAKSARAELTARLIAVAAVNQESRERRMDLELQVTDLALAMAEQRKTDETYKAWADTPLPAGVGERLRNQAAGSDTSALRDSSN